MSVHNWRKCFICLTDNQDRDLKCPALAPKYKSNPESLQDCYLQQLEIILKLQNEFPDWFYVNKLIEDENVEESAKVMMSEDNDPVVWHKYCRSFVLKKGKAKMNYHVLPCENQRPIKHLHQYPWL